MSHILHLKNKIPLFTTCLLLWMMALVMEVQATPTTKVNTTDSTFINTNYPIQQRHFDETQWQELINDSDFLYDRPPPKPSWFDKFWYWLFKKTGAPALESISKLLYYTRYLILLVIVLFVISKLLQADFTTLFFRKTKRSKLKHTIFNEDIHELNFEQLIKDAIKQQDYRKAVRLNYLKSLKLLSNKELIHWKVNKTNQEYLAELQKTPFKKSFNQLTYWFDYVWYGEFPITQAAFERVQQQFLTFNQQIQK